MTAVRLEGITKSFGSHRAVDALSLRVAKGSIYGFIGPNGSGKTTTLRMILNIIRPDSGSVEVLGETRSRAANDRVGYLPEERGLYRKMTVRRVASYYAGLKGMPRREARAETDVWLKRLELADWADRKVETLSKGMQQKLQFISTVLSGPELVILDEPFSGLDPVNLEVLRDAILDLRSRGTTIIFSTHDMAKAEEMCDALCMIFRGRKVLDGTLAEIHAREGTDVIRVETAGGVAALQAIPGVSDVRDLGRAQELRYATDPQELLRALVDRGEVRRFEIARPSLHDIFLRIAGPEASEGAA
ncbi:MAG: ABC transporter [Planctomycetes bacterium]|nr:ABC transporter [Planctomycetota bacterium]